MTHPPRDLGLAQEPREHLGVGGVLREEELDRELAIRRLVAREPDLAHAAAPQLPQEPVLAADEQVLLQGAGIRAVGRRVDRSVDAP